MRADLFQGFGSLLFGWWCFGNCWIIEYVVWVRLVMHAGVGVFADLDFIIVDCSWSNGSVMLGWLDWVILFESRIMSSDWLFILSCNRRQWILSFSVHANSVIYSARDINWHGWSCTLLKSDNKWLPVRVYSGRSWLIRVFYSRS